MFGILKNYFGQVGNIIFKFIKYEYKYEKNFIPNSKRKNIICMCKISNNIFVYLSDLLHVYIVKDMKVLHCEQINLDGVYHRKNLKIVFINVTSSTFKFIIYERPIYLYTFDLDKLKLDVITIDTYYAYKIYSANNKIIIECGNVFFIYDIVYHKIIKRIACRTNRMAVYKHNIIFRNY